MKRNILLILGHPSENSFCNALLDAYKKGAESIDAECKTIYIARLNFNVNLADGYKTGAGDGTGRRPGGIPTKVEQLGIQNK